MEITNKPKECQEVLILTKYGKTIVGEFNAKTNSFMADGYREEEFIKWMPLPEWEGEKNV